MQTNKRGRVGIARPGVIVALGLLGGGCATKNAEDKNVLVNVGAAHFHSLEKPVVSLHGVVNEIHETIGVTARFGGDGPSNLSSVSIRDPRSGVVQVPRSYFEKIELFWPDSLQFAYKLAEDGHSVGEYWVHLDFGKYRQHADLGCKLDDSVDPVSSSFDLYYDSRSRTFGVELKDACGNPIR